jgi:hypothetical protein
LLADLCNILSEFKIERGKLLEALARQFDWPSRAEVDSLHRQMGILRSAAVRAKGAVKMRTAAKASAAVKSKGVAKGTAAAKPTTGPKRRGKRKIRKTPERADQ